MSCSDSTLHMPKQCKSLPQSLQTDTMTVCRFSDQQISTLSKFATFESRTPPTAVKHCHDCCGNISHMRETGASLASPLVDARRCRHFFFLGQAHLIACEQCQASQTAQHQIPLRHWHLHIASQGHKHTKLIASKLCEQSTPKVKALSTLLVQGRPRCTSSRIMHCCSALLTAA